ncbi:LOW QUALITY PROTEIN: hypothetical protein SETIT_2G053200v2 [Setaria italica]|uniref:Uncharacterized protein n=1 Tax=Setaria italica TaxID=4555 RepID=A0A368PVI1_SETIT|nr:LOW QUALITY PROTEIN: hypothetical protein SETIT_2G053200v2 [Setaria italica]
MGSLAFAAAGARAGGFPVRVPASALAPRRRALQVVRAQAEDAEPTTEETSPAFSSSTSPTTPSAATRTPKPKAAKKPPSRGLWDALAFSGPAPERINGRLAMVGFVSALAMEASRGGGLLSQAGSGSGLACFAATAAALSVASLVPLLKGDGAAAADAELWNGRFAMLGLVALAFNEYLTGAPFINA